MEDGQLSPLSASDYESSSSFRQLASDSFGIPSPFADTPRQKAVKAARYARHESPGSSGGATPVHKARQGTPEDWQKLPGHVHFDESVYQTFRANPKKPLQLIGHHLEPKETQSEPEDDEHEPNEPNEPAPAASPKRPKPPKPPPPSKSTGSRRPGKHPPRKPTLPKRNVDLDAAMEVCGCPHPGCAARTTQAPAAKAARWATAQPRQQPEPAGEERVEDTSPELPALYLKPHHRPGPPVHSVSKEAFAGEDDEKADAIESASSLVETVHSFYVDTSQVPSPGRVGGEEGLPTRASKQGFKQHRPAKTARMPPAQPSQAAGTGRTEMGELLPREFAKISRMIATARAKQQRQQDLSETAQHAVIETASVEIQCETDDDGAAPRDAERTFHGRTFMLFRCDPSEVTLNNWRRLECTHPPLSKLELYLRFFAHRFPGALDPWIPSFAVFCGGESPHFFFS